MSHHIDPLILARLRAFSDRRRKLIVRRGIFAAGATLLVTMMAVAFIDYVFFLPDIARWVLSGVAYLAVLVVEWRLCWRLLLQTPDPRELARLVEHAEPKLREDLLSAVELGEQTGGFDSEQFRALVQSDVASRVDKLDMERLLPPRLVRRTVYVAAGLGTACLAAFALTGFQFGTLMMRALLPMANFARVSKVKVAIVEPSPAEMRVPQGDTLPLIIELSGQSVNKATLETFTAAGGREVVPMTPLGRDRFSATIQVGRENVLYRVRAGDAETRKYQLEAVARPAVVEFQKSYTYPDYSKLPAKTVMEENGDLTALEGSEVQLRLTTNQKVRGAELRLEQGKKNTVIPLTPQGDALVAKVPMTTSGIYRVHLVGEESGFENKFSPEYELRAEPDLVPQVELELPKQDLILPSNEIVDVQGTASDDFALAKVSQLVKINEGPWKEVPLAIENGTKTKVQRRWDLFEQGVKPGDLLTTKLVATDLKGNRAESRPLQVSITAAGFESKRMEALLGQRQYYEALKAQLASATALSKQMVDARQQYERLPEGDPQGKQALSSINGALDDFAQKAGDTQAKLLQTLTASPAGHQTSDLALLGLAQVRFAVGQAEAVRRQLDVVTAASALSAARDLVREASDWAIRCEHRTRQMLEMERVFLTAEELDVFSENIFVVMQEQERLVSMAHRSGTDAEKWAPVASRLRVVLAEVRSLNELAGGLIEHGAQGVPSAMRNLQNVLSKRLGTLESALGGKLGAELLGPTLELTNALTDTTRVILEIRRGFRGPPMDKLREVLRETEATYGNFDQLRDEVTRVARNDRIPPEAANALMASRWQARQDLFKGFGDVEEWRPEADTAYVNDLRRITRVLTAAHERCPEKPNQDFQKELQGIDRSFRVLECGHELGELVAGYRRLAGAERWDIFNAKARTTNVADWSWLGTRLQGLPDEIIRALNFDERRNLMQQAQNILRQAPGQPFAQTLNREMESRFDPNHASTGSTADCTAMADYLQQALDLFREPMAEVRKTLEKQTPSLAESMKQLAKKADELKDQATNQAQQTTEKLPEEAKADARQLLAEQQKLNEKVEALKDALRADANQQDILQTEGRERARDADDALAMLKDPPVRAEEDLALAAKSEKTPMQEQALTQAAEQQQKLSQALQKMSDHYAAVDEGKPEQTRSAMREAEKENGIKEQLDQQYAKAEEMAKLSKATPQELLAQLEKALQQNPLMQQELSAISQSTLKSAAAQLKQASNDENAVAQDVQRMAANDPVPASAPPAGNPPASAPADAQTSPSAPNPTSPASPNGPPPPNAASANPMLTPSAQKQTPIAQTAEAAANDIQRAGRHEERLQNPVASEQLQKLGGQVQATAQQRVPAARQSLEQAPQATQALPAVNAANDQLQKALGQLNAATNPAEASSENSPSAQTPPEAPGTPSPAARPAAADGQNPASAQTPKTGEKTADAATPATPSSGQMSADSANGQPGQSSSGQSGKSVGKPSGQPSSSPSPPGEMAASPVSPQEQVWMARTLDALDSALNSSSQQAQTPGQQSGQAQAAKSSGNQSQAEQTSAAQSADGKSVPQTNSMAQAQSAMAQAAQAAAAAARNARSESGAPNQPGQAQQGKLQAMSKGGAPMPGTNGPHGPLADAKNKAGDWGKLPKQMAEQLSQGQREGTAGEYRNQVETYYRAIAEKSKKQ